MSMSRQAWREAAIGVVDDAVDRLVIMFLDNPYMHRSERGIQAELFKLLSQSSVLGEPIELQSRRPIYGKAVCLASQPIQLEWPERTDSGWVLFDLAILSPFRLGNTSPTLFEKGQTRPEIAIEIGLSASSNDHFWKDYGKLLSTDIPHLYLVDLGRKGGYRFELERSLADIDSRFKVAYGRDLGATGQRIKLIADPSVRWHRKTTVMVEEQPEISESVASDK